MRKYSLPVSLKEKSNLSEDISFLKTLCSGLNKRLLSSCSKIDNRDELLSAFSNKIHSFPGSVTVTEPTEKDSSHSSTSESSVSITDTMLKVRRLTHVYDHGEEFFEKCNASSESSPTKPALKTDDGQNNKSVEKFTMEIQKPSSKFGDKTYKLPTKAAAILGANDLLIHQFAHSNDANVNPHALFLENKIQRPFHQDCEFTDSTYKVLKAKKKPGIGTEVKEKFASLWKQSEQSSMSGYTSSSGGTCNTTSVLYGTSSATSGLQLKDMEKLLRAGKATLEQIKNWSHSFESLLHDKFGLAHFHDFLRSEFSDENIEFWIACEEYRTITNNKKMQSRAEKIYNDYVGVQAAREVNLDSKTRQQTEIDIHNPNPHTFDQAQKRIQALMEKDSYQRFLRSELYGKLLRASEEYHISNQSKCPRDSYQATHKSNTVISNLGITAQDLSKLTMTTSKVGSRPQCNTMPAKIHPTSKPEPEVIRAPQRENSLICTVQPDEPSLPFSKQSLLFNPNLDGHK